MADPTPAPAPSSTEPTSVGRLDSWKEIAAHLKRDVTTVRRWEKREGLPVHRHQHERRDSVYAYTSEIDEWWQSRRNGISQNGASDSHTVAPPGGPAPDFALPVAFSQHARWAWALAATFFTTTIFLGMLLLSGSAPERSDAPVERRISILPPSGTSFVDHVVSPDGRWLAFTAVPNEGAQPMTRLWLQAIDAQEAREVFDSEGASLPFWSPASDALGFFADGHLWTVELAGGAPRSLAVAPEGRGATWSREGTIVFAAGRGVGGLSRVAAAGGVVSSVTKLASGERSHVWPEFLPDGRHFVYLAHSSTAKGMPDQQTFVAALDGNQKRRPLMARSGVLPTPTAYLHYTRDRQLLAQPFDWRRFDITGEPVVLVEKVLEQHASPPKTAFSVSTAGTLTYQVPQSPATRLLWRDRAGRSTPLIGIPADYTEPVLAPDQQRVAYDVFAPKPSPRFGYGPHKVTSNIYVLDRMTNVSSQLTTHSEGEWGPVWSPDGRALVFSLSGPGDTLKLILKDATGPFGTEVTLPTEGSRPVAQSWSPDGQFILYATFDPGTRGNLWLMPMTGNRTPIPLLRSEFIEYQGQISPDGRWFAYMSNESGREEVYVQTFPKPTTKTRVSTAGGADPRWHPDGRELYYVSEERKLMAVPVTTGPMFVHRPAAPLFDIGAPPHWYAARNLYDVSRDGRFLTMSPIEDDRSLPLTVIRNWTARLRK